MAELPFVDTPQGQQSAAPVAAQIDGEVVDCVIALNQNLSAAVNLKNQRLVGIAMPSDWTAADLSFQSSYDGVTWNNVYDEFGVEKSVKAAASRRIVLNPADFIGIQYIKVRSGTSGVVVNQAAQRTIKLIAVS